MFVMPFSSMFARSTAAVSGFASTAITLDASAGHPQRPPAHVRAHVEEHAAVGEQPVEHGGQAVLVPDGEPVAGVVAAQDPRQPVIIDGRQRDRPVVPGLGPDRDRPGVLLEHLQGRLPVRGGHQVRVVAERELAGPRPQRLVPAVPVRLLQRRR